MTSAATKVAIIIVVWVAFVVLLVLTIVLLFKNRKKLEDSIINVLEHPKMYIANSRNLVISTQYLWRVTNNFVTENGLGHGGFGVVYKGVTEDENSNCSEDK